MLSPQITAGIKKVPLLDMWRILNLVHLIQEEEMHQKKGLQKDQELRRETILVMSDFFMTNCHNFILVSHEPSLFD